MAGALMNDLSHNSSLCRWLYPLPSQSGTKHSGYVIFWVWFLRFDGQEVVPGWLFMSHRYCSGCLFVRSFAHDINFGVLVFSNIQADGVNV